MLNMPVSKLDATVGLFPSSPGMQAGRGEELPLAQPLFHLGWESYFVFHNGDLS